jgi:hypoxanthine phosphoribosyltransferase
MEYIHYTYNQIHSLTAKLYLDVMHNNIDYVVGINRGGLIPAVMLSHMLDKPLETINWSTRDFKRQEHNFSIARDLVDGKNILLVDDINDSGQTFLDLIEDWGYTDDSKGKLIKVTPLQRYTTKCPSEHYGELITVDNWVMFPWEQK